MSRSFNRPSFGHPRFLCVCVLFWLQQKVLSSFAYNACCSWDEWVTWRVLFLRVGKSFGIKIRSSGFKNLNSKQNSFLVKNFIISTNFIIPSWQSSPCVSFISWMLIAQHMWYVHYERFFSGFKSGVFTTNNKRNISLLYHTDGAYKKHFSWVMNNLAGRIPLGFIAIWVWIRFQLSWILRSLF